MKAFSVRRCALCARAAPRLFMSGRMALTLLGCIMFAVFHPNNSLGAGLSYADYFREKVKTASREYQPFYQGEQLDLFANLFVAPPTWKRKERSAQGLA